MDVTSLKFAFLAVVSVFIFYMIRGKARIVFLSVISFLFIASFSLNLLIYIVGYTLINYFLGKAIYSSEHKLALFRTGIIINIAQLFILKYASFAIDPLLSLFNYQIVVSKISEIIIPVGVSYFTLQGIGYLINVKMGWEKPEQNLVNFSLYLTFFPKFISGPIERSNHFLPQLRGLGHFKQENVTEGFRMVLIGLLKKLVVANQIGLIVNPAYQNINLSEGGNLLFVLLIQPLYLYFDFSGYTDIAIGLARAYGIRLLPNFERPFFAENVTSFWKRFHISLASWFNDYVFKQLSFKLRKYKNSATLITMFVTWTLFGIWHGAGWNFMILGTLQALAIAFEYFTKRKRQAVYSVIPDTVRKWIGRIFIYLFYSVSLVFFFSPDLATSLSFFDKLGPVKLSLPITFSPITKGSLINDYMNIISSTFSYGVLIVFMIIEAISCDRKVLFEKMGELWTSNRKGLRTVRYIFYYVCLLLIFYYGGVQTNFIYFQF
jgi:D-alanyl-lipoteichoic acid acyltransferase DltB (MBOAT superfamily)